MIDIDLFAGPGGWDEGARPLGIEPVGFEWGDAQCATARAAGHERAQGDISKLNPVDATDGAQVRGLIASPPCQGFSMAGKGKSREDSALLLRAIPHMKPHNIDAAIAALYSQMADDRSLPVLEPLRWTMRLAPRWLAWEQVPAVLPIWEAVAAVLRKAGYSVATGNVQAEMYGVPQTRKRAILVARSDGKEARLPTPTHSRYYSRSPERLDGGVQKWVSMAEALGWGVDERVGFPRRSDGRGEILEVDGRAYRGRDLRPATEPSQTVTEKARSWERLQRAAVAAEVAPRVNNQSGTEFDLAWPLDRPSPVVAGREIITMPGANANRFNGATKSRNDGVRVTVAEAAVLQSFPVDYPWQGTKTQQFQQVGDAIPPLLAYHILKEITL